MTVKQWVIYTTLCLGLLWACLAHSASRTYYDHIAVVTNEDEYYSYNASNLVVTIKDGCFSIKGDPKAPKKPVCSKAIALKYERKVVRD